MRCNSSIKIEDILSILSISIPGIIIFFLLNNQIRIIPIIDILNISQMIPIYICPLGIFLGIISMKIRKSKMAYTGIILNIVLMVLDLLFMTIAFRFVMH